MVSCPIRLAAVSAIALLLPLGGCGGKRAPKSNAEWVTTPVMAVEGLQARLLFYNGPARPWLLQKRPDLLAEDDRARTSPKADAFAQAVQNPKLFRQLDRQHRFDAVLLTGDPSQARPLLEHFLEAQDWKLAYLDHTSLVFRREVAQPWSAARLDDLRQRLGAVSETERAQAWAAVAGKLVAVRELPTAKTIIDEARRADGGVAEVWSAEASYRLALGEWNAAAQTAQKALKLDGECLPALGTLAQSFYAAKRFAEAYAVSSRLVEKLPEDPGILFYHAKIAHESRHFDDEVRVLRKLIAMAERSGQAVSGYRVYLGQALGTSGEGEAALSEFRAALADPDLPPEQRNYAHECIGRLREKIGQAALEE
jgi:tetratricopeptide (TPR) repeat protein